ncbi:LigB family dioxygenase [compost metagenome]
MIEEHDYTDYLKSVAAKFPKPKAIVIFSAHWESKVQAVSQVDTYSTIYDFSGFSDELYSMTYPAKGDHGLAKEIVSLFANKGIDTVVDTTRGLDHGAWAVLKLVYPVADIPVVALSVNRHLTAEEQYETGKILGSLKEQDVMIIGSGGAVHNLRRVNWNSDSVDEWAIAFENWIQEKIENWDTASLFRYQELAPYAKEAVPTAEHFIPLLIAMGSGDQERSPELLHRSYQWGNLSLTVWQF